MGYKTAAAEDADARDLCRVAVRAAGMDEADRAVFWADIDNLSVGVSTIKRRLQASYIDGDVVVGDGSIKKHRQAICGCA
jgi:hypothetical protein